MNTIQEALRELMIRKKDANKTNKEQSIQINEDKKIYHNGDEYLKEEALAKKKEPLLPELWDQVYCTLIDAGDNKIYEICGGKGKYNPDEATVRNTASKYGDNIISIIYDKDNESKTEDEFFAEAKRVAEKFGLKSDKTDKKTYTLFNLSIPQDEPVYFDLIPEKFRAKIAAQNDEDLDDLPVSPKYNGEKLTAESLKESVKPMSIEESIEEFTDMLPINILSESEIIEFIDSVPKATAQRGPASLTFTIGFVKEVDVASQFKENGRGHVNKETGENFPTVRVVKCSEIAGLYLESYGSSKKTIAYRKEREKERQENPEIEAQPEREVVPWLEPVEGHRNLFRSKNTRELVLVPLLANNAKTRSRYFISIDGEALRTSSKEEILPYLTPAKQLEITAGKEDRPLSSPAQPLTFYLKKIYRIGNKGYSIF